MPGEIAGPARGPLGRINARSGRSSWWHLRSSVVRVRRSCRTPGRSKRLACRHLHSRRSDPRRRWRQAISNLPLPLTPPPVRPLPSVPIDGTIEPVSRSRPGAAAAAALAACGVDRPPRLDTVAAMGLVSHAHDVPRYARMFGTEPELQTDAPAWVIQLAGRIDYAGHWADNPVCVVIGGQHWTFAPEVYGGPDAETGQQVFNPNPSIAPDPPFRLPSLAP